VAGVAAEQGMGEVSSGGSFSSQRPGGEILLWRELPPAKPEGDAFLRLRPWVVGMEQNSSLQRGLLAQSRLPIGHQERVWARSHD
jgi:hypothetical protein